MSQFTSATRPLAEAAAGRINSLMDQGLRLGLDLIESLNQVRTSMMTGMTQPGGLARMLGGLRIGRCGCDIPPPCWMPVSLGAVTSFVCPGGTATLRIRVANCGDRSRQVIADTKQSTLPITATPANLSLGPQERGVFTLTATVPATATAGQEFEALVWVRGCKDYYQRWTLRAITRGADCCCHEVDVADCPDLVHHWYDHFYCQRPCPERSPDTGRG